MCKLKLLLKNPITSQQALLTLNKKMPGRLFEINVYKVQLDFTTPWIINLSHFKSQIFKGLCYDQNLVHSNLLKWPNLGQPKPIPMQLLLYNFCSLTYKTATCLTWPVTSWHGLIQDLNLCGNMNVSSQIITSAKNIADR